MAETATPDDRTIERLVTSAPPLSETVKASIAALFRAGTR
ncbi:hypothetical protein CVS53_02895 [Microbacterium oxydans]|nr:hypothetical protein CVS53_02895 [Microbacterium oxydans]